MKRLPVLAALLVVATATFVAPGARAEGPALSAGCANLHNAAGKTITSSNEVVLTEAAYNTREQVLVVGTSATGAKVAVDQRSHGAHLFYLYGDSGQPIRASIGPEQSDEFHLLSSQPATSTSWQIDCGIPPRAEVINVQPGEQIGKGRAVPGYARCTAGSNPVAHCVVENVDYGAQCSSLCDAPVDTSTLGDHTITVTATDTAGLSTTSTVTYTVVKVDQAIYDISIVAALGSGSNTSQLYFVSAKSTSGLPVKVTVDPSSGDTCDYAPTTQDPTWVGAEHAGTCVVDFDQAGDDTYAPAPRVTRTIVIDRDHAVLVADPAQKGILGLTPTKFASKLIYPRGFGVPLVGEKVSFSVAGKTLCTGVVGNDGYARCSAPVGVAAAFSQKTYTATYAGSRDYYPVTSTGQLRP
ncbi:MAG: hypothetical protein ACJ72E_11180 [Marmoricola sp.]